MTPLVTTSSLKEAISDDSISDDPIVEAVSPTRCATCGKEKEAVVIQSSLIWSSFILSSLMRDLV
jgi:hypothetical protein